MSQRAKTLQRMFKKGMVGIDGLKKAVGDGVITPEEFEMITGMPFTPPNNVLPTIEEAPAEEESVGDMSMDEPAEEEKA